MLTISIIHRSTLVENLLPTLSHSDIVWFNKISMTKIKFLLKLLLWTRSFIHPRHQMNSDFEASILLLIAKISKIMWRAVPALPNFFHFDATHCQLKLCTLTGNAFNVNHTHCCRSAVECRLLIWCSQANAQAMCSAVAGDCRYYSLIFSHK